MTYHTIYLTKTQTSALDINTVTCSLCDSCVASEEAAVGPYDSYGELTHVCNRHLRDPRQFINLLADFITTQRFDFAKNLNHKLNESEGTPDAWFLY
jgi:hypothetical protein